MTDTHSGNIYLEPFFLGIDSSKGGKCAAGSSRKLNMGWEGMELGFNPDGKNAPIAPGWTISTWIKVNHAVLSGLDVPILGSIS